MDTKNESTLKGNARDRVIIRTSFIGISANFLLAAVKAVIGLIANSIAVVLDAVNNLSDVISSVVTIVGTKLASRKPDKKHPLGHGRIEYLSAMIVAAIVLYAGVTSLVESIKKIISPEVPDYSPLSLIIIAVAVAAKLVLGMYVRKMGNKVNSGSLIASGTDALYDAILSASVLASALVFVIFHINLEAYVGVIISLFIIRSGIGMLTETLNELLGKRVDREFLASIRDTILKDEKVRGVYDLILHSYGPDRYIGSVHVEIPDTMNADEIDAMERRIAENVYLEHGVILGGIGIYSANTKNTEITALRTEVLNYVTSFDGVIQVHGFYADLEKKAINLDVILDYSISDRDRIYEEIDKGLKEKFPDYSFRVTQDIDV
ncbi:MAG: cation transporter [Clostridia bacterium]|nr:cation transporter [Clostridia bacterium]